MTRAQHAALMWAQKNLTGKRLHDYAAFILELPEREAINDEAIREKYPFLFNNKNI